MPTVDQIAQNSGASKRKRHAAIFTKYRVFRGIRTAQCRHRHHESAQPCQRM